MAVLILFIIFILLVIVLLLFILIRVLSHKNKGNIDYGDSSLNILENNTTSDEKNN